MPLELPELAQLNVDGPVAYREWEGPQDTTFVMVHGLGGSGLNWVQVAPALAGLGRVIAVDLPGFGETPLAGRSSGLMDQRRVLGAVIDRLGQGRIIVCGNSMGGALAILQAAIAQERVEGLVLSGSVFPWVRGGRPSPAVLGAFFLYDTPPFGSALVRARMRQLSPDQIVRLGLLMCTADPKSIPADVIDLHVDLVRRHRNDPGGVEAFIDAARSMLRLGRRPEVAARALGGVGCPVLVLHGRRDRLVPARFAEATLRRYPSWHGRIFPDLGHIPQMEAPGRWVAEVADWFASGPGSAAGR